MTLRLVQIAAAALVAALALAACGEGEGESPGSPGSTPAATTPASVFDNALWPDPAAATSEDGPLDVARSFFEDFLGVKHPALGEFQQGDTRSGEVPVLRRREDGTVMDRVIATIGVRQLDGERWFVIFAVSDDVEISEPRAGENEVMPTVSSPVKITGKGRGFEGSILVHLHAAFDAKLLAGVGVQGGSTTIEPFSAELAFMRPQAATGAIVVTGGSGIAGAEPFAAIPVRFGAG